MYVLLSFQPLHFVFALVVSALFFGGLAYFKKQAYNKMNAIVYRDHDLVAFEKFITKSWYRFFIEPKNRKFASLTLWLQHKDYEMVESIIDSLQKDKLDTVETFMLIIMRLRNYLNQGKIEQAQDFYETTKNKYQASKESIIQSYLEEMEMMIHVDWFKDFSYVNQLQKRYDPSKPSLDQSLIGLRLYQLHAYRQHDDVAQKYYDEVVSFNNEKVVKELLGIIRY